MKALDPQGAIQSDVLRVACFRSKSKRTVRTELVEVQGRIHANKAMSETARVTASHLLPSTNFSKLLRKHDCGCALRQAQCERILKPDFKH